MKLVLAQQLLMQKIRTRLADDRATGALARLQRTPTSDRSLPAVVAVLPLDQRTWTSPTTAAIALMMAAVVEQAVVAVDADGTAQPMRRLLGSSGSGDIVGLATSHDASLRRRRIEDFVDMSARVPLASCWAEGPGAIPPEILREAISKLRRRFPTVVIDLPFGCPMATVTAATALASHVILVADRHDCQHEWLHSGDSLLAAAARRGAVSVAVVGGVDADRDVCPHIDTIPVPQIQVTGHSADGLVLPLDRVDELTGLYELVLRSVKSAGDSTFTQALSGPRT